MKRIAVDSTSIASIGYEPRRRELEIEFRDSGMFIVTLKFPSMNLTSFLLQVQGNLSEPCVQDERISLHGCETRTRIGSPALDRLRLVFGKESRGGKAEDSQPETVFGFYGVVGGAFEEAVFSGPGCWVGVSIGGRGNVRG